MTNFFWIDDSTLNIYEQCINCYEDTFTVAKGFIHKTDSLGFISIFNHNTKNTIPLFQSYNAISKFSLNNYLPIKIDTIKTVPKYSFNYDKTISINNKPLKYIQTINLPPKFILTDLKVITKASGILPHSASHDFILCKFKKSNKKVKIYLIDPTQPKGDLLRKLDITKVICIDSSKLLIQHRNGFNVSTEIKNNYGISIIDLELLKND